jgi:Uma2 family endonuclease
MKTATKAGPYTFEDFCVLVKDGDKADLIDGVIYMASPENWDAHQLYLWLSVIMDLFVEATDAGNVFGSRVALRLGDRNGPEPDVGFIRKARRHLIRKGYIAGPADLAMEIVSPESIERDYHQKRRQYQEAGIPEYWIVDPLKEKVTLLSLGRDGKYREVRPRQGELHSRVLPGFWLRPDWLWQKPRPKKTTVLQQLLARLT